MAEIKRLYDKTEVAKALGNHVKPDTIKKWAWQGKIRSRLIGGKYLFTAEDVNDLIERSLTDMTPKKTKLEVVK